MGPVVVTGKTETSEVKMKVSELVEKLLKLPQDINVQVMTSEGEGPNDIVQVSRGTWSNDIDPKDIDEDDAIEDYHNDEEPEFIQDDNTGKIAVLVTW
jgi:hypothetical protein